MTPLLLFYVGLWASISAVSLLSLLILPPGIIACILLFLSGLYLTVTSADQLLLTHGVQEYIPPWLHSILAERDLFELWVDFLRENNPIMIFLRLTALKVFDLNREEAVVLMGGVATPWMKRLRQRTVLSFLPDSIKTRYAPDLRPPLTLHHSSTNSEPWMGKSRPAIPSIDLGTKSSLESLQTAKGSSLSFVLASILKARLRPRLVKAGPKVKRVALKLALGFLLYSLVSRTQRWRNLRAKINLSPVFWSAVVIYLVLPVNLPWPLLGKKCRTSVGERVIDVLRAQFTPGAIRHDADLSDSPMSTSSKDASTKRCFLSTEQ